jgi:hypothetical protein
MISWIVAKTGLSAIVVKLLLIAVASGSAWYALRLYGNRQWAAGELQGRISATQTVQKAKEAEWKFKETAIAADAKTVADEKLVLAAASERLTKDRINLSRTLKDSLARIQAVKGDNYANVLAVPDPVLWDAIRKVSRELDGAQP